MPKPAQDRFQRGPLSALLILLSLFLGSGTAAATGSALAGPAARPALGRSGAASALLAPSSRNGLNDETSAAGDGPAVLPAAPAIVTRRLWTRILAAPRATPAVAATRPIVFFYRARGPPAA